MVAVKDPTTTAIRGTPYMQNFFKIRSHYQIRQAQPYLRSHIDYSKLHFALNVAISMKWNHQENALIVKCLPKGTNYFNTIFQVTCIDKNC